MTTQRPTPALAAALLAAALFTAPLHAEGQFPGSRPRISVSPQLPTSADALRITVAGGFSGCVMGIAPRVDGATVRLAATYSGLSACPVDRDRTLLATLPALGAGTYIVLLEDAQVARARTTVIVSPATTTLDLHEGRHSVRLGFRTAPGSDVEDARAVALTRESGYFWFYSPVNPEVTLKLLDGQAINGHFWLFASSLTDRPFTLTVRDNGLVCQAPPCANEKTYTGTAGVLSTLIDFAAP